MDLNMLNQKLVAVLISVCFFSSESFVLAQESERQEKKFSLMSDGDVAPFSGMLFNPDALGDILTEGENEKDRCDIELRNKEDTLNNECKLKVDKLKLSLDIAKKSYDAQLEAQRKQITKLEKELTGSTKIPPSLYVAGGVIVGIGLSLATFFLIKKVDGR